MLSTASPATCSSFAGRNGRIKRFAQTIFPAALASTKKAAGYVFLKLDPAPFPSLTPNISEPGEASFLQFGE